MQKNYSYLTITNPCEGFFKDKGSRFISLAFPVSTEEEIKKHLHQVKKKYFDASHHCYAYILGADQIKFRVSDDDEPNHTAGYPILGQLRAHNLTDALVVVVRYFGGTKLGVGGLITAYREATANVLSQAVICEREVVVLVDLIYDYTATPEVMRLVKEFSLQVLSQEFTDKGYLKGSVSLRNHLALHEKIKLLVALGHSIS